MPEAPRTSPKSATPEAPEAQETPETSKAPETPKAWKTRSLSSDQPIELRKLSRAQLLSLLRDAVAENERLHAELDEARRKLDERRIVLEDSESLAEAALRLSGTLDGARTAAALYGENAGAAPRGRHAAREGLNIWETSRAPGQTGAAEPSRASAQTPAQASSSATAQAPACESSHAQAKALAHRPSFEPGQAFDPVISHVPAHADVRDALAGAAAQTTERARDGVSTAAARAADESAPVPGGLSSDADFGFHARRSAASSAACSESSETASSAADASEDVEASSWKSWLRDIGSEAVSPLAPRSERQGVIGS